MEINEKMEIISDKIRMGIPVGIVEAIEAIDYQERLRLEVTLSFWSKLKIWMSSWIR